MARLRGAGLLMVAPGAAIALSLVVAAGILALAGADPLANLRDALAYGLEPSTLVAIANKALPYYLAGIAAAVGFHLRLFNIGIDGQYRLAAFAAAVVGAAVSLPAPFHVALMIVVALVVGWGWAAIAGLLYVRRGVNVVISTIMLNAVATGIIAYLLSPLRFAQQTAGSNNVATATLPERGWIPGFPTPAGELNGALILAVLVGVAYWTVLNRTTVGFEVRAMGLAGRAATVAGLLYVRRGVNVVISTIMLNAVATGIIAYLLSPLRLAQQTTGSNNVATATLPESGWIPGFPTPAGELNGALILAVLVGVAYWTVLNRTTIGFEVRAMGLAGRAATVAGMRRGRLAVLTMGASGAIAGLVGIPQLLGATHRFGLDFPAGLGFTGLSVAILGRNHPVGVAIAAFVWAFLERSAQVLDLAGVSREVVTILQAVIVLSIVVAYELVRRVRARRDRLVTARAAEGAQA